MDKKYNIFFCLFLLIIPINIYAVIEPDCDDMVLDTIYYDENGSHIQRWGSEYYSCQYLVFDINVHQNCYIKFTYIVDLDPVGAIDFIEIKNVNSNGTEGDVLYSNGYSPAHGIVFTTVPTGRARIRFLSLYGNYQNLSNGFKIDYDLSNTPYNLFAATDYYVRDNIYFHDVNSINIQDNIFNYHTQFGDVAIGAKNSIYSYFTTTQSKFYINKPIFIQGGQIGAYSNANLQFLTNNTPRMTILNNGKIGIGIFNPTSNLQVSGEIGSDSIRTSKIKAEEIVLELQNGADFVFDDKYNLRSLLDLQEYIKKNGHLPGIESADEMKRYGVSLNDLIVTLLQKIEELTLYLIKQENDIIYLKDKVNERIIAD